MVLLLTVVNRNIIVDPRPVKEFAVVETLRFPVLDTALHIQHSGAADHFGKFSEAHLRHVLTYFFSNEEEIVDDVFGLSRKFLDQLRILRRYPDRARVEMAFAHHDAAFDHKRGRGKSHLIGAEQRTDND